MLDNYILDSHTPVLEPDLLKWGIWMEAADRVVAKTQIGEAEVSTVFLGSAVLAGVSQPVAAFDFNGQRKASQSSYTSFRRFDAANHFPVPSFGFVPGAIAVLFFVQRPAKDHRFKQHWSTLLAESVIDQRWESGRSKGGDVEADLTPRTAWSSYRAVLLSESC